MMPYKKIRSKRWPWARRRARAAVAPRRRRIGPSRWWLAAAAVLLLFVGFQTIYFMRQAGVGGEPVATVASTRNASIERWGLLRQARQGEVIYPGDRIVTDEDQVIKLNFPEAQAGLYLGGGSELLIPESGDASAHLERGRLWSWVTPDVQREQPFVIVSPEARATVVGTKLQITVQEGSTRLDVTHGKVKFDRLADRQSVDVSEGHFAVAKHGVQLESRLTGAEGRESRDLQALYLFDRHEGDIVPDVSGVGDPLDLKILDMQSVNWMPVRGLRLNGPARIFSERNADKILRACQRAEAITIEAWVSPAAINTSTRRSGMARIVTFSSDAAERNFTLGQGESDHPIHTFAARLRTTETSTNGKPSTVSPVGMSLREATHVVFTRDNSGRAALYVNGEVSTFGEVPGNFSVWKPNRLGLGQEFEVDTENHRAWTGDYYLVAIYGRALDGDEVQKNYKAGVPGVFVPGQTATPVINTEDLPEEMLDD